jgi:hypothetical protein
MDFPKRSAEKKISVLFIAVIAIMSWPMPAPADNNSFFGANAGGSTNKSDAVDVDEGSGNAGLPGLNSTGIPGSHSRSSAKAPAGDYTEDEKRMQRKFKANMRAAKGLIDKGERMMKAAGNKTDDKDYKKGKIIKETGEKWLSDLKASNPFEDEKDKLVK